MASTDAKPISQKNVAYRVTFPIFDADGDLVTGATGLDSEISKDGGAFTDCTNEATEIATSSGMYYLDLTSTEMNADTVAVIVKTSSSGAKTTPIVMYPEEAGDIRVNATQVNGTNQTAGDLAALINTVDDFLDTEIAAIKAKTDNLPSDPADASDIATSFSTVNTKLDTIDDFLDTEVAAIKAKTDNLPSDPADASDIASSFSTVNTKLDTIDDFVDTEIAAIKTVVDGIQTDLDNGTDGLGALKTLIDNVDNFVDTEVTAIKAVTDKLDTALELDGAVYRYTADALEQAPTGGTAPTVTQIRQEMDTNSTKLANLDAAVSTRASQASVDTVDDFLDTEIAAIKAKTDNLPSDPADASDIASSFSTVNTKLDTIDDFLDTEITAIKSKTDNLPASPAAVGSQMTLADDAITAAKIATDAIDADSIKTDAIAEIQSGLATAAALSTVGGYIDTEIGALQSDVTAVKAKTDNLPSDPADASVVAGLIAAVETKIDTIDTVVDNVKVTTDKLDDTLEDDAGTYRFTENALEESPAGGGSSLTAEQTAAAVWNAKVDIYQADRSFGSKIGLYLPVVSPDIDYKRIKKVIKEEIDSIPKPEFEKVDLEPISKGLQSLLTEIRAIKLPDIPKTDLQPVMSKLETLGNDIKAIEIPETDLSETNSLITSKNDLLDLLADAQEEIKSGQLERIREFFEGGLDQIQSDIASLKETLNGTQMVVLKDKKAEKEPSSSLDEYLNLR